MLRSVKYIVALLSLSLSLLLSGCIAFVLKDALPEPIETDAYMKSETVSGKSRSCAVVLQAEQGMTYKIILQTVGGGRWAYFKDGLMETEGTIINDNGLKEVNIVLEENASGQSREACAQVQFSDGQPFTLFFTQEG